MPKMRRKVSGEVVPVTKKPKRPLSPSAKRASHIKKVRKENDLIWSALVKMRVDCISEKVPTERELIDHPSRQLNSHHYFRKEMYPWMRWDVRNGICIYSWQHVKARGSAHNDPAQFDAWAIPYLKERGDYAHLLEKAKEPEKTTLMLIEESNAMLREMYYKQTGSKWGE